MTPEERVLVGRDDLRIAHVPGRSATLVVSLSGVGTRPSRMPPPEFFRLATRGGAHHGLFVADAGRRWLNAPGMAEEIVGAVRAVAAEIGATRIVAVGNSMGGTMALHLAGLVPFDGVLAFVPQYSVDPDIVPEEARWMRFRRRIADWPHRVVTLDGLAGRQVFVLHGATADELHHARRFPRLDGVDHHIFPVAGHRLARDLKEAGRLDAMIGHLIDGRPRLLRRAIRQAGGVSRGTFEAARGEAGNGATRAIARADRSSREREAPNRPEDR